MGKINIIGLGPGNIEDLTLGAVEKIKDENPNFLRTKHHPTVEYFKKNDIGYKTFDYMYEEAESFEQVYIGIVDELIKEAKNKDINYFVPGNPMVAEKTVELLVGKNIDIEIISGLSFIEPMLELLGVDPIDGLRIVDGILFDKLDVNINENTIITQVHDEFILSDIKLILSEIYGDDHLVYYVQNAGLRGMEIKHEVPIYQLDRLEEPNLLTSLFVPVIGERDIYDFTDLLDIMAILRSEDGCSWDRDQNHKSLRGEMIEEAYEAVDAIDRESIEDLVEELGDVLLQVVFHSQIGEEEGNFNILDVTSTLVEKLIYRHPHVFSKEENLKVETSSDIVYNWDVLKQERRKLSTYTEILKDVKGLPSLLTSYKVQKAAAKVGFDWENISGPLEKIKEEYKEILEAIEVSTKSDRIEEEIGDILFSVVNLARFLDINPEVALNVSTNKFIKRFEYMEKSIVGLGRDMKDLSLEELDEFWNMAKKEELD